MSVDPHKCIFGVARLFPTITRDACSVDSLVEEEYLNGYIKFMKPVLAKYPNVEVIDPAPIFVERGKYVSLYKGRTLYRDAAHLSRWGSKYMADKLKLVVEPH